MVPKRSIGFDSDLWSTGTSIDPQYYNQYAATQSLTHALRARPAVEPQSCREMRVKLINHQNIDATNQTRKETHFPFHEHVTFWVPNRQIFVGATKFSRYRHQSIIQHPSCMMDRAKIVSRGFNGALSTVLMGSTK